MLLASRLRCVVPEGQIPGRSAGKTLVLLLQCHPIVSDAEHAWVTA